MWFGIMALVALAACSSAGTVSTSTLYCTVTTDTDAAEASLDLASEYQSIVIQGSTSVSIEWTRQKEGHGILEFVGVSADHGTTIFGPGRLPIDPHVAADGPAPIHLTAKSDDGTIVQFTCTIGDSRLVS